MCVSSMTGKCPQCMRSLSADQHQPAPPLERFEQRVKDELVHHADLVDYDGVKFERLVLVVGEMSRALPPIELEHTVYGLRLDARVKCPAPSRQSSSSIRCMVFASTPVAAVSLFAALPVGAHSAALSPRSSSIRRMHLTMVVLPVPGPPVTICTPDAVLSPSPARSARLRSPHPRGNPRLRRRALQGALLSRLRCCSSSS